MQVFQNKTTKTDVLGVSMNGVILKSDLSEQCNSAARHWFADSQEDSGGGRPINCSCSIMMQRKEKEAVNKNDTKSMLGLDSSRPDGAHAGQDPQTPPPPIYSAF